MHLPNYPLGWHMLVSGRVTCYPSQSGTEKIDGFFFPPKGRICFQAFGCWQPGTWVDFFFFVLMGPGFEKLKKKHVEKTLCLGSF